MALSTYIVLFCLCLSDAQAAVRAQSYSGVLQPALIQRESHEQNPTCGFAGNSDIYSLGIRLGLYLQWIASYLTVQIHPDAIPDLLDITLIYETALFIATAVLTLDTASAYSTEIMLLTMIFFTDFYLIHFSSMVAHKDDMGTILDLRDTTQAVHRRCYGSIHSLVLVHRF